MTVAVHDYFAVCPSFVLLDADGRYCGIPDVSVCATCLPRHQARYVALSPPTEIGPWRALWGRCLAAADEVRCFSASTRRLLLRAYPDLDANRISVVPHRVDFVPARLPALDHAAPLVIGIIGSISVQKGAQIVKEMLARIDREHPDVRVVVIGALDIPVKSPRLEVTGNVPAGGPPRPDRGASDQPLLLPVDLPGDVLLRDGGDDPDAGADRRVRPGRPGERLRGYRNATPLRRGDRASRRSRALVAFHDELAAKEVSVA